MEGLEHCKTDNCLRFAVPCGQSEVVLMTYDRYLVINGACLSKADRILSIWCFRLCVKMTSAESSSPVTSDRCAYDHTCDKIPTEFFSGCRKVYCIDHAATHHKQLKKQLGHIIHARDLLNKRFKESVANLSSNIKTDLIEPIDDFKMKANEITKIALGIEQKLQASVDEDEQRTALPSIASSKHQHDFFENEIQRLRHDIHQLTLKLEYIDDYARKNESQGELLIRDLPTIKTPLGSDLSNSSNSITQTDDGKVLSHLVLQLRSPSILYLTENQIVEVANENETGGITIDLNSNAKISHKIHLNNTVAYLRGPLRVMKDGSIHLIEVFAQGTHISDSVIQAVKQSTARQNQKVSGETSHHNPLPPTFVEITPQWQFEGENSHRGFSGQSIWLRDPDGKRVLVKTHDHPFCAVNEWLAYALAIALGLPINKIQISTYQNNVVTLHTDVADENEETMTLMDLPRPLRKQLMADPIMESMDIFDHLLQNVDRNPTNILITIPKGTNIEDPAAKPKFYLIDHSACFGMGHLSTIRFVAYKFHRHHLVVVKFDPEKEAQKFEQYLMGLPTADRALIGNTLNFFAKITDDQFDAWLTEVQDLLSTPEHDRVGEVLRRQRDIARRYTVQWGIASPSSSRSK